MREGELDESGPTPAVPTATREWDYRLDGLGNWGEYRSNQTTRRTTVAELNHYSQADREWDGSAWTPGRAIERDFLGNVHREERDGMTLIYHHDALSRLVRLEKDVAETTTRIADYGYDAFNRRIETDIAGGDRRIWVYDGWRILDELGYLTSDGRIDPKRAPSQVVARNVFGIGLDEQVYTIRDVDRFAGTGLADGNAEEGFVPVHDFRGSPERILSVAGALLESYEYDPYGGMTVKDALGTTLVTSAKDMGFGFTGHRVNTYLAAGSRTLLYARNRTYDPQLGRFMERDPIGLAGGENQYVYTIGQPVTMTDSLGLYPNPGWGKPKSSSSNTYPRVRFQMLGGGNTALVMGGSRKGGKSALQLHMEEKARIKYAGEQAVSPSDSGFLSGLLGAMGDWLGEALFSVLELTANETVEVKASKDAGTTTDWWSNRWNFYVSDFTFANNFKGNKRAWSKTRLKSARKWANKIFKNAGLPSRATGGKEQPPAGAREVKAEIVDDINALPKELRAKAAGKAMLYDVSGDKIYVVHAEWARVRGFEGSIDARIPIHIGNVLAHEMGHAGGYFGHNISNTSVMWESIMRLDRLARFEAADMEHIYLRQSLEWYRPYSY